jgi:photosystem II stability/assembly factor-like uncharacterized protein
MTRRYLCNAVVALAVLTLSAACSSGPASAPAAHRYLASSTPTTATPRPPRRHQLSFDEQMRAIRFADQTHGLLLHRQCSAHACRTVVHATADGGAHWHQQGSIPFAAPRVNLLIANRLDAVAGFSRLFGEPWRPDRAAYATTDGGRHWRSLALPSHSAIATITPRRILAARNKCNRNGTRCAVGIFAAASRARHFSRISTPPTGGLPIAGLVGSGTPTVYISAGSWWAGESKVLVSTDAGTSWRTAPNPCSSPGRWSISLSPLPGNTRTVWALCSGQPAAGTQEKELAISSDAGSRWINRPDPSVGGYGTDISVTGKADAWQFEVNRADVMSTTNAGRSWRDTLQGRVGESAGGATYWFDPLSTDDAWVISLDAHQRSLFLRTTDAGRHWQQLRLPF